MCNINRKNGLKTWLERYWQLFWEKRHLINDSDYLLSLIGQLSDAHLPKKEQDYILHYGLYAARKCARMKRKYLSCSAATVICPLLVLFISKLPSGTIPVETITALLTFLSAIAASILSLFRFHEEWIRYRDYVEKLFLLLIVPPMQKDRVDHEKLMKDVMALNHQSNLNWIKMRESDGKQNGQSISPKDSRLTQ